MEPIALRKLEVQVVDACNLGCESCSHFAASGRADRLSLADARAWYQAWHKRVRPERFALLGGEPALHPQLVEHVRLAAEFWPDSSVQVVTNGLLLTRHPGLGPALAAVNGKLRISVHHHDPSYQEALAPGRALATRWEQELGLKLRFSDSFAHWTRRYHGRGAEALPYADGDPAASWERCKAKLCWQLFRGQLWKCAPIAYLQLQKERFPALSPLWDPYLRYQPLAPDCSDAELAAFVGREAEAVCGMCPARPERFDKPNPLRRTRTAGVGGE